MTLSSRQSTCLPWSRNHSATVNVACAARRRARAGWSEVATTTTVGADPPRPDDVEELAHLAAALADQPDDDDIGGDEAGQHAHQR